MPKTTAIVLTYTHPENVERIVDSLRPQGCEIVVADDGLDGVDRLALDGFDVQRYHHERNGRQPAKARNGGAALANTEYIVFLDDDCFPAPDLIVEHEKALARYDVSMGLQVSAWDDLYSDPRLLPFENEQAPTSWMAHAGNLGIRREAFLKVGGFDAKMFDGRYGWEDTDLGVRLELAGYRFHLNRWALVLNEGHHVQYIDPARGAENKVIFDRKRAAAKRVMIVSSGHMVSTYDVYQGWDRALRQAGHIVLSYNYHSRLQFFNVALGAWARVIGHKPEAGLLDMAGEGIMAAIVDFVPDVIVVVCGLVLPPMVMPLIHRLGVPVVSILTESPYSDEQQERQVTRWSAVSFTNDRSSLQRLSESGKVVYLPHSYDPLSHAPRLVGEAYRHDVFFFGTLYPERKAMLERVRWTGINASISGTAIIPVTDKEHGGEVTVTRKTHSGLRTWQPNSELAQHYSGSKISLSWHRTTADYFKGTQIGQDAYSLGPRAYEIPACGGFMLSDAARPELSEVYGDSVPMYADGASLRRQVRYYLAHEDERKALAQQQRVAVGPCTFRNRLDAILWPEVSTLCP